MPNRILREGILTSPRVAKLGWAEEVFYRRLMSVVDDYGRYYADYGLLHAACYPRQLTKVSDADIGKWLTVCVNAALVSVYPAQDGERYLELLDFGQQVRAKKSRFPDPPADAQQMLSRRAASAHLDVSVSEGVSESSEAKASDGEPSAGKPEKPKSPEDAAKADVWRAAVDVLQAGGCKSEATCRSFMGKLVGDYTFELVREAVAIAASNQPADAREYLKATCMRLKGERAQDHGKPLTVPANAAAAAAQAAADAEHRKRAEEIAAITPEQRAETARLVRERAGILKVVS